ncbi:hypothetical protein SDC9_194627 [bioreactor metagenome]|uniref:Uncharacterized protein n=1 Tax=bioreactor metagenome TaxID=1076179 RepID=A0A645I6R6_9ZZZZ
MRRTIVIKKLRAEIISIALRQNLWYRVFDRLLLQGRQSGEGANYANTDSSESYESHLFN